jgi:hypothetical protein
MIPPTPFQGLRFADAAVPRPALSGLSVITTLRHFAIVSYAVPANRVRPHVHPAFALDTFAGSDGQPTIWVSIVPFEDLDFRFAAFPWAKFHFGQTNYRTYVINRATGQRAAWFFGTTLDSWTVLIPQLFWRLPWYRGRIRFDCQYDRIAHRYARYQMTTRSRWGAAELELTDSGSPVTELPGILDLESGLVALTHPLRGAFYRRDGKLGTYSVWHDPLRCTAGQLVHARIALLDRLGLVSYEEQTRPHSVLIQPQTEFAIYLPPVPLVLARA